MIFQNYRELINFVLSHYPYEKILMYTRELHYPWRFQANNRRHYTTRYPRKIDIKKQLVLNLSNACRSQVSCNLIPATDINIDISELSTTYYQFYTYNYFRVRFNKDRTILKIVYNYEFYGRQRMYHLPHYSYKWGNKKTEVVFKFSGETIL